MYKKILILFLIASLLFISTAYVFGSESSVEDTQKSIEIDFETIDDYDFCEVSEGYAGVESFWSIQFHKQDDWDNGERGYALLGNYDLTHVKKITFYTTNDSGAKYHDEEEKGAAYVVFSEDKEATKIIGKITPMEMVGWGNQEELLEIEVDSKYSGPVYISFTYYWSTWDDVERKDGVNISEITLVGDAELSTPIPTETPTPKPVTPSPTPVAQTPTPVKTEVPKVDAPSNTWIVVVAIIAALVVAAVASLLIIKKRKNK